MKKVIVNIHGAGKQMSNFSDPTIERLTVVMGEKPAFVPCWYADLSNVGSPVLGLGAEPVSAKEIAFEGELARQIERTADQVGADGTGPDNLGLFDGRSFLASVPDLANDLRNYFFVAKVHDAIRQRLINTLTTASQNFDEILLVSHSLGTVVSYDVLHDHADQFKIAVWVTMGSPLKKVRRMGLRDDNLGKIDETTVPLWRNLYDTHDLVADAIGPQFPSYPIQDVFYPIANTAIEAHDYWGNARVVQLIASFAND